MSALDFISRHHNAFLYRVDCSLSLTKHTLGCRSFISPQKCRCKISNATGCITFKWINTQFALSTRDANIYIIKFAPLKPKYVNSRFFSNCKKQPPKHPKNHMTNNTLSNAKHFMDTMERRYMKQKLKSMDIFRTEWMQSRRRKNTLGVTVCAHI